MEWGARGRGGEGAGLQKGEGSAGVDGIDRLTQRRGICRSVRGGYKSGNCK